MCFTSGGSLVIAYLEHGIMYVVSIFQPPLLFTSSYHRCWSSDGKTLKWSFTPRAFRMYADNTFQLCHLPHCELTFVHASGRFFYSPKTDLFVVHNLYDGFDAYTMKSHTHFRSYRFPTSAKDNVPLSCTLINSGRHVVCGTTSGKAVVLDATTLAHQADLLHCGT